MFGLFKGERLREQRIYIERYDEVRGEMLIRYFSHFDEPIFLYLDGRDRYPSHRKVRSYKFIDRLFVNEYRLWLPLGDATTLSGRVGDINTDIYLAGRCWRGAIPIKSIREHFREVDRVDSSKFPLSIRVQTDALFKYNF